MDREWIKNIISISEGVNYYNGHVLQGVTK